MSHTVQEGQVLQLQEKECRETDKSCFSCWKEVELGDTIAVTKGDLIYCMSCVEESEQLEVQSE